MNGLMLHAGARVVELDELAAVKAPEPTRTWVPIPHVTVLETVTRTLAQAGFEVTRTKLALSANNARFFGTLDLSNVIDASGRVTLTVGVRASIDQTFPQGFVAGNRVFVCDNLSFSAELMAKAKYTRYGSATFSRRIFDAVAKLSTFVKDESARIDRMKALPLSDQQADSVVLRSAIDDGIVNLADVPKILSEYRKPAHEEFAPRNAWSLFNAYTSALGATQEKSPERYARKTLRLSALLSRPALALSA